jgi:hypothetical protein
LKAAATALLCSCLALTGCNKYFAARGIVSSPEGHLGAWSSTPPGCTRDPFDGLPISETSSVLTFLWQDPSIYDPLRGPHRFTAPDAPMRLTLSRAGTAYAIGIDTVKTEGTHFDSIACTTFAAETHETPKTIPEGRPSLSGTLRFDCRTAASHITANIRFNRCEY